MNRYGFALAGSISAIISARAYVGLGGGLDFSIFNHVLHHFYYGISLLILAGILKVRNKVPASVILFLTGMALGFVCDEFDLLLSIGRPYTLQLYNAPLNLAMDVILVLVLFRLSQTHNFVHGFLPGTEHAL